MLQTGAVIGKEFAEPRARRASAELSAKPTLTPRSRRSRRAEFVYEQALYPVAEYAFKHPLTQEVAIARSCRSAGASARRGGARDRGAARRQARRAGGAAGASLGRPARPGGRALARRAARWVGVTNAAEACATGTGARLLADKGGSSSDATTLRLEALRTLLMLSFRVETSEDAAAAMFADGQRYARATRRRRIAGSSDGLSTEPATRTREPYNEYLALAVEASRIAERSGDRAARAAVDVGSLLCSLHEGTVEGVPVGRGSSPRVAADDAGLGAELVGYSPYVLSYVLPVWTLIEMGCLRDAEIRAHRGLELAQKYGPEETRAWAHGVHVNLADAKGDLGPAAANSARLATEAAERSGSEQARVISHLWLSLAGALDGQWNLAIPEAEEAIRVCRSKRIAGDFAAQILAAHARALLGSGDARQAADVSAEAIVVAKRQGQPVHQCEATIAHVRCLRALQGAEGRQAIEMLLAEMSELIDQTGAERWRPTSTSNALSYTV